MHTLRTGTASVQAPPSRQCSSGAVSLLLVNGAYLSHCQKCQNFDSIHLVKQLAPSASCLYYSYANSSAPSPLELVSNGIFPVVVDPSWNTSGRPKGLDPYILPDLLLYGETYDRVIIITASGDFVPSIKALNQREITKVEVAAFLCCPISAPLIEVCPSIIDLTQFIQIHA